MIDSGLVSDQKEKQQKKFFLICVWSTYEKD